MDLIVIVLCCLNSGLIREMMNIVGFGMEEDCTY